jgi:hypothetical protein
MKKQNIPNGHKIYQHIQLQDPPKFTQIGIFRLKIYHLATLLETRLLHIIKEFRKRLVLGKGTGVLDIGWGDDDKRLLAALLGTCSKKSP